MTEVMDNNTALRSALDKMRQMMPEERIRENEPMSAHTSFRIGGPAGALVTPENEEELAAVLRLCAADPGLEYMLIGNGSNFLVADEGYPGIFIKLSGDIHEHTGRYQHEIRYSDPEIDNEHHYPRHSLCRKEAYL